MLSCIEYLEKNDDIILQSPVIMKIKINAILYPGSIFEINVMYNKTVDRIKFMSTRIILKVG